MALPDPMTAGLGRIRAELEIAAAFPAEVEVAALAAARRGPVPPLAAPERDDRRDLDLVTLDPPGSRDLDQAFAVVRRRSGWTVWYAIADVAAFVSTGDPIDLEANRRGVTLYLPDGRAALHPPALSEGAASLLPGEDRAALLWRLDIDDAGRLTSGRVRRAVVRSRAKLDYPSAQAELDAAGVPDDAPIAMLRSVGQVLVVAEAARRGVSLSRAEQVVEEVPDAPGRYRLAWRTPVPVEQWNAQLSLLCGRAAANLMLQAGVGVLRVLPPYDERALSRLQRAARVLGITWPGSYPAFIRSLDPTTPAGAALMNQAARVLRGSGYVSFGPGVGPVPKGAAGRHAAVAAPYAHVTAPLRRLVDRAASEIALSIATRVDPPAWALAALVDLPDTMQAARQREAAVDRAVVDLAEAVVLASRIGERLAGVVIDSNPERGAELQLLDPPVRVRIEARRPLGAEVTVRVESADPVTAHVVLRPESRP